MHVRGGLGGGDGGDFEVGHFGFDADGHLVADGRRVGEYLDRVCGVRDVVGQFVGEELAELFGDSGGGESGVDGADRAVEVRRLCLNIYILPVLGNAWIGDLDLPDLNETIRSLTLQDGSPASGGTKSTVAAVLRRLFAWAREERIIPANPALELRTGWGSSVRRRVLIPSIPQVMRLAEALDHFKKGLGDVAMLMAFTGLRWEEAVAVPIENVDLDGQWITVDRTASESGGKRDIRADLKTRAAERVVAIPDIAMPAVRRLVDSGAKGREMSTGKLYTRLVNGERGGYLGYAMWRRYLKLAHGYTAAHPDGIVKYTAHELRHVCASLLIASGATDMQVANQMGHSRIETTKNIYGHLFAQDRATILQAMNQAVTRLYVQEDTDDGNAQAA